jgi:hypothetical protein
MFRDLYTFVIVFIALLLLLIILSDIFETHHIEGFEPTKKIAFCFMVYDKINHEEVWKKFFESADRNKYNIYIHYKENVETQFDKYKLKNCIDTKWGDVSLVKASNLLFRTAFENDPANYKFVLVSNSCIPLKSFDYMYNFLTKDDKGYINQVEPSEYYKTFDLYKKDPALFGKSGQFVILNRKIVEKLAFIDDAELDANLQGMNLVDEIYYHTFMKHAQLDDQVVKTPNLSSGATTFTLWGDMKDYPYLKGKEASANPYSYDTISSEEMDYLLAQPCLFGRKFNKNCVVIESDGEKKMLVEYLEKL